LKTRRKKDILSPEFASQKWSASDWNPLLMDSAGRYIVLSLRLPPFFFLVFGPGPGQHERQQQQNKMSTRRQSTRYTSGRAIVPKKKGKLSIYPIHLKYKHTHTHTQSTVIDGKFPFFFFFLPAVACSPVER
jgi:hypothetical protein